MMGPPPAFSSVLTLMPGFPFKELLAATKALLAHVAV
jgi:hypothetical protein